MTEHFGTLLTYDGFDPTTDPVTLFIWKFNHHCTLNNYLNVCKQVIFEYALEAPALDMYHAALQDGGALHEDITTPATNADATAREATATVN